MRSDRFPFFSSCTHLTHSTLLPLLFGIALLAGSGCTSTHQVSHDHPSTYGEVTRAAIDKTARVHLSNGVTLRLDNLYVTSDSTMGVSEDGQKKAVPTADVLRVEVFDSGTGALKGAGIGFASPLGIGILGSAGSSDPVDSVLSTLTGVVLSIPGAAIGAAMGAIRADRDVYDFPSRSRKESPSETSFADNKPETNLPSKK